MSDRLSRRFRAFKKLTLHNMPIIGRRRILSDSSIVRVISSEPLSTTVTRSAGKATDRSSAKFDARAVSLPMIGTETNASLGATIKGDQNSAAAHSGPIIGTKSPGTALDRFAASGSESAEGLRGQDAKRPLAPMFGTRLTSAGLELSRLLNSSSPICGELKAGEQPTDLKLLNVLEDTERARQRTAHQNFDGLYRSFAREVRERDPTKLGSKRGKAYATFFVAQFVVWYEDLARIEGPQHGYDIAVLAHGVFTKVSGLEMPIVRNFLGALKRHPTVQVEKDRRIYDEEGRFLGKGTFYLLPAKKVGEGDPFHVPVRSHGFLKDR